MSSKLSIIFVNFVSKNFTNPFVSSHVDSWGGNGISVGLFNSKCDMENYPKLNILRSSVNGSEW